MKHHLEFLKQFRERFETTGAIAPSSRFLARSMTAPLRQSTEHSDPPLRVLEIGPGTGAVTGHILASLRPTDRFDLVELNESFVRLLQQRFETDARWRDATANTQLHNCAIQGFQASEPYDFVISGLPLNNFPAELVEEVLAACFRLLKPGGVLSYFEYMYVRTVRKRVGKPADRERLTRIDKTMASFTERYRIRRDSILCNLPPAWVQHLQKHASQGGGQPGN